MRNFIRRGRNDGGAAERRGFLTQAVRFGAQKYFVYFKASKLRPVSKDPPRAGKMIGEFAQVKRERGELPIRPAYCSRFALSDMLLGYPKSCRSGRQDLAALCTAAGKNLTAVGSSHSLPETVDLGTMTAAGLIGTLHILYTSCQNQYARQSEDPTAATHS